MCPTSTIPSLNWQLKWNGSFFVGKCITEFFDFFFNFSSLGSHRVLLWKGSRRQGPSHSSCAYSVAVAPIYWDFSAAGSQPSNKAVGRSRRPTFGNVVGLKTIMEMVAFYKDSPKSDEGWQWGGPPFLLHCYELNCALPTNSYVKILIPSFSECNLT